MRNLSTIVEAVSREHDVEPDEEKAILSVVEDITEEVIAYSKDDTSVEEHIREEAHKQRIENQAEEAEDMLEEYKEQIYDRSEYDIEIDELADSFEIIEEFD